VLTDRLVQILSAWVNPVAKCMNWVASVALFLMMLLTIADVFLRKVYSKSILGTVEVTEFMMVILVFFALAHAEVLKRHVKVDLVLSRFSQRVQAFIDTATQFVLFLFFGLITWSALVYAGTMRASGEVSQDLWIPIYPFVYIVAIGCSVLGIGLLINCLSALRKMVTS